MTDEIRVLDLFAGAGGLTQGFHQASPRFRTVAAVEMEAAAAASFQATFGAGLVSALPIETWLRQDGLPERVDIIVGGPPCQGFSTLGKQDAEDDRNALWRQYAETIRRAQPSFFVVENVGAFAKSPQLAQFADSVNGGFLSDFDFQYRVLNAADYGVAQSRRRTILIGHHRDLKFPGFPEPTHSGRHATVREALAGTASKVPPADLPPNKTVEFGGRQFAGAFAPSELHVGRTYSDLSLRRFAKIPPEGNRFNLPDELKAPCWRKHTTGSADVMGRLFWDKPSVTIRTEFYKPEKGRYLHPVEDRAITHYEAALLQGFPESHRFVGSKTAIAKQIGNAVPIPLGVAIARQLLSRL